MSNYDEFDEFYCQEYKPIADLREAFRNSGDRVKEYAAETARVFKERVMVKPEGGFISKEHEQAFTKSWNGNRAWAHRIKYPPAFASAPVGIEFKSNALTRLFPWIVGRAIGFAPDRSQPFGGAQGPDVTRQHFEGWWTGSTGASQIIYQTKGVVADLDNKYEFLASDNDRAKFIAAHPGYRPPEPGEERASKPKRTAEEARALIRKTRGKQGPPQG